MNYYRHANIIVKLPSDLKNAMYIADMAASAGVQYLHAANTFPTSLGGLSGPPLKKYNITIVEELAKNFPAMMIIGGGGIYTYDDILDYRRAGANLFSTATVWFNPFRGRKLLNAYYYE